MAAGWAGARSTIRPPNRGGRNCLLVLTAPESVRLERVIVHQRRPVPKLQLVVLEVLLAQIRPLLEDHCMKTGRGKLLGNYAPCASCPDYHEINLGRWLIFSHSYHR